MMKSAGELLSPSKIMKSAGCSKGRKKGARLFKDFYVEWVEGLKTTLLPLLRHSISATSTALLRSSSPDLPVTQLGGAMVASSDLLSAHVQMVHRHFQAYFQALDAAARQDVSQVLFPDWRNSLEKPFLWFGDLHPSVFTTLLRSFLNSSSSSSSDDDEGSATSGSGKPLPFAVAWKNPSGGLLGRVRQIELGLRLFVPSIAQRHRDVQARFAEGTAVGWVAGRDPGEEEARAVAEELEGVFADANRLRKSILAEMIGAMDVYHAALYLEALCQFVVGLRDEELLHRFEQCKVPLSPAFI